MSRTWTDSYSKFSNLDSDDELDESVSSSNKSSHQQQGADANALEGNEKASSCTEKRSSSRSVANNVAIPTCFDWGSGSAVTPNDSFAFQSDADFARMHARVKALPQLNSLEVWQVSLATLRCWTANNNTTCSSNNSENDADSGDSTSNQAPPASVLRPRAVLVACIYPDEGRLLGYDVNVADPGSRPTAPQTTACLLRLMLDPLFGAQRRPGKVVFHDAWLGNALFYALGALKVEASLLPTMPAALRLHSDAVARLLIKAGGASEGAGGVSEGDDSNNNGSNSLGPLLTSQSHPSSSSSSGSNSRSGSGTVTSNDSYDDAIACCWAGLFAAADGCISGRLSLAQLPQASSWRRCVNGSAAASGKDNPKLANATAAPAVGGSDSDEDAFHSAEEEEEEDKEEEGKDTSTSREASKSTVAQSSSDSPPFSWQPPWLALPSGLTSRHAVLKITLKEPLPLPSKAAATTTSADPPAIAAGDTVWLGLLHDDSGVLGFAAFYSRLDAEARLRDPAAPISSLYRPYTNAPTGCAFANYCAASGDSSGSSSNINSSSNSNGDDREKTDLPTKLKRTKPRSFDVRNGRELAYGSPDALRKHWPHVRQWSRPLSEREEGIASGRTHWHSYGEIALLYRPEPQVAWDDLDLAKDLNLPGPSGCSRSGGGGSGDDNGEGQDAKTSRAYAEASAAAAADLGRPEGMHELFPSPLHLSKEGIGPCSATDVAWLTVAARVVARLPKFLENTLERASANTTTSAHSAVAHVVAAAAAAAAKEEKSAHVEEWQVDIRPRSRTRDDKEKAADAEDHDGGVVTAKIRVELDPVLETAEVTAAGF